MYIYICIYAYMHACMHTYIHTLHTYIHTLHTCIHAYMHTCIHAYIHIYICIYIYIYAYIYIHMHIHTYIYIYIGYDWRPVQCCQVAKQVRQKARANSANSVTRWELAMGDVTEMFWKRVNLHCICRNQPEKQSGSFPVLSSECQFFWQVDHREQVDSCSADMASVFIGLKAVEKTSGSRSWSHAAMCPMFVWQLSQKTIHVTIHVTIWTFKISSDDLNHPCFKNTGVKSPVPRARQVHHVTLCRCWGSWGSWGWAPSQESWLLSPLVKFDVSAMIFQVTITTCRGLVASPVWIA